MLPYITINAHGVRLRALVDTGCQQTIVLQSVSRKLKCVPTGRHVVVKMLNGASTTCSGEVVINVEIGGLKAEAKCLVAPTLVENVEVIMGMDLISCFGGVFVSSDGAAWFGGSQCAVGAVRKNKGLEIDDNDFKAVFDGVNWTVEWKWVNGEPMLTNKCQGYRVPSDCKEQYEEEVEQWIKDGWLQLYNHNTHGEVCGVIPLMAVKQPNKERKV